MHWIIQNKLREEPGVRALAESLPRWGIPHSLHDLGDDWKLVPEPNPAGNVIVIGAYAIRHEAKRKGWTPGVFEMEFGHRDFVANWGPSMLNASASVCAFRDAPKLDLPERFFCRPGHDDKLWKAGPMNRDDFLSWHAKVMAMLADPETVADIRADSEAVIGPLHEIAQEHRCWIVDGHVVTTSLYKRGDQVVYDGRRDQDVWDFAQSMAAHPWQPQRAYALDVSVGPDRELHVIEVNNLGSAGLYAADVQKLVSAIEAMVF